MNALEHLRGLVFEGRFRSSFALVGDPVALSYIAGHHGGSWVRSGRGDGDVLSFLFQLREGDGFGDGQGDAEGSGRACGSDSDQAILMGGGCGSGWWEGPAPYWRLTCGRGVEERNEVWES